MDGRRRGVIEERRKGDHCGCVESTLQHNGILDKLDDCETAAEFVSRNERRSDISAKQEGRRLAWTVSQCCAYKPYEF